MLRTLMDEGLPAVIRDNKYFMYPFFYIWFKGENIRHIMEFKTICYTLTPKEMTEIYRNIKTLARDRVTDLNEPSTRFISSSLDSQAKTLLDIGCGNGYFLQEAQKAGYQVHGCDVFDELEAKGIAYTKGDILHLPFADNSFDIVTCHHTIEHIPDLEQAIAELKRVARKQVIVTTPCQRWFYYTLDLHVNFFPNQPLLQRVMKMQKSVCKKIWGDWVYVGEKI
jgi:SAM-dependent methyltransferase